MGKNLGPWPVTNQICVNCVCLCQERSANLCYISKRADSRLREVSVPSCEREKVFEVCLQFGACWETVVERQVQ